MKTLSLDLETYSSVDLGKSSVYRYVESPDFDILLLGYSAIRSQELEKTAYPIMKRLMDKCGLSVILTSLTDMQSLCVEKIEAEDDLQLSMRVGGIYPLHKGASNRPLLAYMEQWYRESGLPYGWHHIEAGSVSG